MITRAFIPGKVGRDTLRPLRPGDLEWEMSDGSSEFETLVRRCMVEWCGPQDGDVLNWRTPLGRAFGDLGPSDLLLLARVYKEVSRRSLARAGGFEQGS